MANRADVFVRNVSSDNFQVIRNAPDGTNDLEIALGKGVSEKIHLPEPEVALAIKLLEKDDTKDTPIKVKSDVDLSVFHSRSRSCWTFKIVPNNLPPDSPASVNITLGDDEPEYV